MFHNTDEDDRVKISDATRARIQAKGLKFDVPEGRLPVVMLDDFVHTIDYPICDNPDCVCHRYEYERYLQEARQEKQQKGRRKGKTLLEKNYELVHGALNGNKGFQLLR